MSCSHHLVGEMPGPSPSPAVFLGAIGRSQQGPICFHDCRVQEQP